MTKSLLIAISALTIINQCNYLNAHIYLVERPRLQIVDTGPREPRGMEKLLSDINKYATEKKEAEVLKEILDDYRRNREDPFALEDAKIALERSDISANRKLEFRKFLNDLGKNR